MGDLRHFDITVRCAEVRDTGTWADYVSASISKYNLRETWEHSKWGERFWKRRVVDQLEREGARAWKEEVEQRQNLGCYKDKQLVLREQIML